ncbi:MAG: OmpA family protein [Cytophagaceae bacterium]|jgi:outer membrane protein OmpA-like peptidoglycan-associated protein|nr:OmpA family protein [Cytophagaceae bacterium]
MKTHLFILILLFAGFTTTLAQIDYRGNLLEEEQIYKKGNKYNLWSVMAGFGPVIYYADVVDYTFVPSTNLKFGPSFNVARQFGRSVAIDVNFLMADMYGQKYQRYFTGDFMEFTANVTFYINQLLVGGPLRDKWNFYARFGFGGNFFRSAMRQLGTNELVTVGYIYGDVPNGYPTAYTDWNMTDYLVEGYSRTEKDKEESRKSEIIIPMAVGVKYRINKSFDLGLEASLRTLSADNLDVDMTGADTDSYVYTAFSLTYKIGKKDKRHASWTYRDFNFDISRDRARDPLAQKLDSLNKLIDYLAANDSVVNDTTVVMADRVFKTESFSASVFFDFDKSTITNYSHRTIANLARFMKDNPEVRMLVQGYCDDRGSYEYNEKLSIRRCNSVKDVLVKDYGIDASRFDISAHGKAELLSDTRALAPRGIHLVNRRVDVFPIIK